MTDDIRDVWPALLAELQAVRPKPLTPFRPGAAASDIRAFESRFDRPFPDDFRTWLGLQDGQDDAALLNGVFNHARFLSLAQMSSDNAELSDVLDADVSDPVDQPAFYRQTVWSPGWIRLTDTDGDGYVVDLDPGELGTVGQVFYRPNTCGMGRPIASSVTGFFQVVRRRIADGDFEVEPDSGELIVPDLYAAAS